MVNQNELKKRMESKSGWRNRIGRKASGSQVKSGKTVGGERKQTRMATSRKRYDELKAKPKRKEKQTQNYNTGRFG